MGVTLGIDLGTSSAKLLLADESGRVLASSKREYRFDSPAPGWREIDPAVWWDAVCDATRELLSDAPAPAAVGVTGQMHTMVPLASDGSLVRKAILWNDDRSPETVAAARKALLASGESYDARIIAGGSPAASLAWMKEMEPEAFGRISTMLIGPDWIVHALTGSRSTDYCEASTSALFDLEHACWSERAASALGIPEEILPEVRGSAQVAGLVSESAAEATGIPAGTPVVAGTGDNPAAALTTGCITQGTTVVSLGTSGVLMRTRDVFDPDACGKSILLSLDGEHVMTLVQGVIQACGLGFDWWTRTILAEDAPAANAEIDESMLGAGRLLYFPHLTGEKTLYADPSLTGAFLGLTPEVGRGQMTLAVMEGICFGFRLLSERMGVRVSDGVLAVGGGARSDIWMRAMASVLDAPVSRSSSDAGACLGAALLAQAAVSGGEPSFPEPAIERTFEPEPELVAAYTNKYDDYLRIHDAVRDVYR